MDQRTFSRAASLAPAEAANLPALPLITVRFDAPLDSDAIAGAVQLAMSRRPGAIFEVVAPVPSGAPRAAQEAAVRQGQADAEQVATAMAAAGADRARIQLGLRADPGVPGREVRVYVR